MGAWVKFTRSVLVVVLAACADPAPQRDGALGSRNSESVSSTPAVAIDLAPSQVAGSTVAGPAKPPPCSIDDLELWTAQVRPGVSTVEAVIRVRNDGDGRCDADISRSSRLDPAIEPDVWLEPGQTADLVVGPSAPECEKPAVVTGIEVIIGDDVVVVPTAMITCEWALTAFYPNDPVRDACDRDQLDLAVTRSAVVVRNASARPCGLGGIVEVDGAVAADRGTDGPSVAELLPGDVVAFGRVSATGCDSPPDRVELFDEVVGELIVEDVPCELEFSLGAGHPWYGAAVESLLPPAGETVDVATVVDVLVPFDGGA